MIGLIALGIVAITLVVAVTAKLVLHLLKRPLEARVAAHYRPDEVLMMDLGANSFGLESKGVWQGRGNGALVLTADYLHFFRFVPGADLRVPPGTITEVTFTKSHLGKATIYDLLKVRFVVDGKPDSIAWYVADPRAWKERIEEVQAAKPSS
jgi:hypothetical protein